MWFLRGYHDVVVLLRKIYKFTGLELVSVLNVELQHALINLKDVLDSPQALELQIGFQQQI